MHGTEAQAQRGCRSSFWKHQVIMIDHFHLGQTDADRGSAFGFV